MPRVYNYRHSNIPDTVIRADRRTKWGNPHRVVHTGDVVKDNQRAADLYREYLNSHPELVAAAKKELRGEDLGCWDSPLPCHCDILLEVANA